MASALSLAHTTSFATSLPSSSVVISWESHGVPTTSGFIIIKVCSVAIRLNKYGSHVIRAVRTVLECNEIQFRLKNYNNIIILITLSHTMNELQCSKILIIR